MDKGRFTCSTFSFWREVSSDTPFEEYSATPGGTEKPAETACDRALSGATHVVYRVGREVSGDGLSIILGRFKRV